MHKCRYLLRKTASAKITRQIGEPSNFCSCIGCRVDMQTYEPTHRMSILRARPCKLKCHNTEPAFFLLLFLPPFEAFLSFPFFFFLDVFFAFLS